MRDAGYLSELHDAGVISGASLISSMSMGPHEVVQPVALGKGRKPFAHLVDVVGPDETDQQALERIEAVYESERMNRRFFQVLFVMES